MIIGIDHVQITVPANAVVEARAFYCGLLDSVRSSGTRTVTASCTAGVCEGLKPHPARGVREGLSCVRRKAPAQFSGREPR
jgi:hypothetical protein